MFVSARAIEREGSGVDVIINEAVSFVGDTSRVLVPWESLSVNVELRLKEEDMVLSEVTLSVYVSVVESSLVGVWLVVVDIDETRDWVGVGGGFVRVGVTDMLTVVVAEPVTLRLVDSVTEGVMVVDMEGINVVE